MSFNKDVRSTRTSLIVEELTRQSWRLPLTLCFNVVVIRFRLFCARACAKWKTVENRSERLDPGWRDLWLRNSRLKAASRV